MREKRFESRTSDCVHVAVNIAVIGWEILFLGSLELHSGFHHHTPRSRVFLTMDGFNTLKVQLFEAESNQSLAGFTHKPLVPMVFPQDIPDRSLIVVFYDLIDRNRSDTFAAFLTDDAPIVAMRIRISVHPYVYDVLAIFYRFVSLKPHKAGSFVIRCILEHVFSVFLLEGSKKESLCFQDNRSFVSNTHF